MDLNGLSTENQGIPTFKEQTEKEQTEKESDWPKLSHVFTYDPINHGHGGDKENTQN